MNNQPTRFRILRPCRHWPATLPILLGADTEVSSFIEGIDQSGGTGDWASRLILREIRGFPREMSTPACRSSAAWYDEESRGTNAPGYDPQDWNRQFLPSGACFYIDMTHPEACLPEVRDAFDYVAAHHALLRVLEDARQAAGAKLPERCRLAVLINNSDGHDHSYGSHLNFLIPRATWDDIFFYKPMLAPYLASFQITHMVLTGAGKVGAENGRTPVDYQISQRADFLERLTGLQTTYQRPIVNSRDEPLCGRTGSYRDGESSNHSSTQSAGTMARLHVICYDSNLCHVACLLKVGLLQIQLAMMQRGRLNPCLILDDPVRSVVAISHDPTLTTRVRTITRKRYTAVELQLLYWEEAMRFAEAGGCDDLVPRANEVLALAGDTLEKLKNHDFAAVSGRLDWVLKKTLLEQAMSRREGLTWSSPQIRHLDQVYASSDRGEGLYWACERGEAVERIAAPAEIERFIHEPPSDTRAWTRGKLLALAGEFADSVNWDTIRFYIRSNGCSGKYWSIDLADPTAFTRQQTQAVFGRAETLDDLLDGLSGLMLPDDSQNPAHEGGAKARHLRAGF